MTTRSRPGTRPHLGAIAVGLATVCPAAHADFSATAEAGIGMVMVWPLVLLVYLLLAPAGRRLRAGLLGVLGLPLWATGTLGWAQTASDSTQAAAWWRWTLLGVALGGLLLWGQRRRWLPQAPRPWACSSAQAAVLATAAGVWLPTAWACAGLLPPRPGLDSGSLQALQLTLCLGGVGLWWHQLWAWRLVCVALAFTVLTPALWQPALLGQGAWWCWLLPALPAAVWLALPGTRQACAPAQR